MTAPPRPQWLWDIPPGMDDELTLQVRFYIEHLERYIEQLEATQREATWRPDRESDLD